jgi:hypothetical protein
LVLRTKAGELPSLIGSAAYSSAISQADSRAPLLAYLSHRALSSLMLSRLSALPAAVAGSLTDLTTSLVITGRPSELGLSLRAFLPVTTEMARAEVLPVAASQTTLAHLLVGEELAWSLISQNPAEFSQKITTKLANVSPHTAELLQGAALSYTKKLLGEISLPELSQIFTGEILVGESKAGEWFMIVRNEPTSVALLKDRLLANRGTLTAGTEIFTLPDGTLGQRLVAGQPTTESFTHSGTEIIRNERLAFFALGDFFVASSSTQLTTRLADRLIAGNPVETTFANTLAVKPDLQFPWILPFAQLSFDLNSDPAGIALRGELVPSNKSQAINPK